MTPDRSYPAAKNLKTEQNHKEKSIVKSSSLLLTDPALLQSLLLTDPALLQQLSEKLLADYTEVPEERMALVSGILALIAEAEGSPAGITIHLSDPTTRQPAPALPKEAPERWADRPSRTSENPVAFIERVYASWLDKGLTRAHLRELDRPLYQALAKWLERYPVPEHLKHFFESRSDRIDMKLAELAITNPTDAYTRVGDRREAERLYQAALWRRRKAKGAEQKTSATLSKLTSSHVPSES